MITVIYGSDRERARAKWRKLVEGAKEKGSEIFMFHSESWSEGKFEELINGQNIFGNKLAIICDHLLTNAEAEEFVARRLEDLVNSSNNFLLLETEISKELLKKLEKAEVKLENFEAKTKAENKFDSLNIFSLTDALGARDRKKLWLLYTEALELGLETEEIFWKFVWQVKNLLLVKAMGDRPVASMKPYTLSKARGYAKNFTYDELSKLSSRLLHIYTDARKGKQDFAIALERLILEY